MLAFPPVGAHAVAAVEVTCAHDPDPGADIIADDADAFTAAPPLDPEA